MKCELNFLGTTIKCSFTRMLVLDTWMSVDGYNSDADRRRRVFQTLTRLLPDVENVDTNDLQNRINYICKKLVSYWKQATRNYSRIVAKYSDWLNEN